MPERSGEPAFRHFTELPAHLLWIALGGLVAGLPKESGRFDLPIAIGILVATGQLLFVHA